MKELDEMGAKERQGREREKAEKAKLQSEIDTINLERDKAVTGLRAQFDKELAAAKDRAEKEMTSTRAQFNAEVDALRVTCTSLLWGPYTDPTTRHRPLI